MTRRPLFAALALAALSALSFTHCSSDSPKPPIEDPPPVDTPAPYGLDVRPLNSTCLAHERPVESTGVTTQRIFPKIGFRQPVFVLQAPGDASRVFVVLRGGTVQVFPNDNAASTTSTFVDITSRVNSAAGTEAGLLGMAFHPQFATNHEVFLSYTGHGGPTDLRSVISRFKSNDNGATLDPASEEILLTVDQPYPNHNGGNIAFGPDGYLYLGLGDGGSAGDPQNNAQNLNSLLGKFLRIDVNGAKPYAIPPTNPFRNGGGRPEIYAWGLRNPWRWSFDRATGELWAGDVGQDVREEVDRIVLGGNYGWRIKEGDQCYNPNPCNGAGLINPIVQYTHAEGIAITGGYVYRGSAIPSLVGHFLYADYGSGTIWAVTNDPTTGAAQPQLLVHTTYNITSFGEMADGEVLVVDYQAGIYKLVPTGAQQPSTFPQKLSETGCVDPADPKKSAPGLIPYDVNSPLWSDGAAKERYIALPDGKQIRVGADGDWELPIGTVLMKTFSIGDRRVETRLLMHHPDGTWGGYSYEWDDAQTDATLLPANKSRQVGSQTWYYPSRAECVRCHTSAAGFSLGLETGQLNRELTYASTGRSSNQLATLDHIGLFETPLTSTAEAQPHYPAPTDSSPLELRARAYLHANCSFCHRPNSTGQGPADFRYFTPWAQVGVCNAAPQEGDLGIANARLLAPGEPARSILSVRMHSLGVNRMPPLGTSAEDTAGAAVVDAWISSLTTCP